MEKGVYLGATGKKILKIVHILCSSVIFGGLAAILRLLLVKSNGNLGDATAAADIGILEIFTYGVEYVFFVLLATAVVYGIFTEWGFISHRWIIAKIVLVAAVFAVTWVGLGPAIGGMASISDAGLHFTTMSAQYLQYERQAVVCTLLELVVMAGLFVLSVLKPWGATGLKLKQKLALAVLLPLLVIGTGFGIFNEVRLSEMRSMPIGEVNLQAVSDGTYRGEALVGSYVYKVDVEVKDHTIVNIKGVDNRESQYVTYAEGVFRKIIDKQKADVDAVTGATTTSKAFMKAVENAINGAK